MALHLHDNDESADQHGLPFNGNINRDDDINGRVYGGIKSGWKQVVLK